MFTAAEQEYAGVYRGARAPISRLSPVARQRRAYVPTSVRRVAHHGRDRGGSAAVCVGGNRSRMSSKTLLRRTRRASSHYQLHRPTSRSTSSGPARRRPSSASSRRNRPTGSSRRSTRPPSRNRVRLAKLAQEETGLGKWQDKVIKNVVASQFVYEDIKDLKTVGIISEDPVTGIVEIAQPVGPILAIIPVTNPTSTAIFKILIALKTRNPIILSPSRKAKRCSDEAAQICYEAALEADAPEHCIQWLTIARAS